MASKANFKNLPNMTDSPTVTTAKTLAAEFGSTPLKVAQVLNAAGLEPIGKLPVMKDGKPSAGKPTFAFDADLARKAMTEAVQPKVAA